MRILLSVLACAVLVAALAGGAKAILWADPAGNAMGWYQVPNDFNVTPAGAADANDFLWYNLSDGGTNNYPGGYMLKTADDTEKAGAFFYAWRTGFTKNKFYTLRFTMLCQTGPPCDENITISVKNELNNWVNFSQIHADSKSNYYSNTSTLVGEGGNNKLGIPIWVNDTGWIDLMVWSNTTGAGVFNMIGGLNVTNMSTASDHLIVINYNFFTPRIVETKNSLYNISVYTNTTNVNATLFVNGTAFGPLNVSRSAAFSNFSYTGIPPYLVGTTNSTNYTIIWQISLTGNITNFTYSQEIERLIIQPCAAPFNNQTIKFSIFDEETTTTKVISNFGINFRIWIESGYRNYSYSNLSYADYSYCVFPGWAAYKANISAVYTNGSYSTRNFFADIVSLNNATTQINLYSLPLVNSTNTFFTIYNTNKIPQPDVIVKVLRFYPSTGTFLTVAYGRSGYDGNVMIPLKLYEYYQYLMQVNGLVLSSTGSTQLTSITQNLYLSPSNYIQLFNYVGSVFGSCTVDNTTKILTCTVSDTSGQMTTATLTVKQMRAANTSVTVCTTSGSSSAMVLTCNLTYYNSSNLYYTFGGVFRGETYTIDSGWISWSSGLLQLGITGVFITFLLVITLFFAGMTSSPSTGIALGSIGILIASITGMIQIGWGNLLPFLLVAVILVYKMGED